ncbi:hypothetical protein JK358_00855 [Nocardia sp. 2]|uniref:DUF8020 domain-containing protein n=1 Tax=Nocardia acididurans TaxID=2802282 RepID=A0ABS1LZJ6_9NOCA|nr:hypothetical protein [Nocardia acididurans]MBL1072939.1 hypothetical protein [Nocardia acididurans]
MKFRSTTAAAALVIGAMTIGTTVANAEPAAPVEPAGIDYSVKLVDKTVVTKLRNGTFELTQQDAVVEEGAVAPEEPKKVDVATIKDISGNVVMTLPMNFSVSGVAVPVKPVVSQDGTTLELTPERPADLPQSAEPINSVAVKPIASPVENQRAMNEFTTQFGLATAVGGFVGTAVGVIVGGAAGIALGAIQCATVILCIAAIPTFVALAGIGGVLGTIAFGAPALGVAGLDLLSTLQAPAGTSKWSDANQNGPK